jgi:NADPH-dependent curcumin reductase CurA
LFGWQEYAAASDKHVNLKIAPRDLPLSLSLGVLGLNGFTAYFGLLDIGLPLTAALLSPVSADAAIHQQKRSQLDRLYQRLVDDLDALIGALGLKAA